jgi:hypothetical protein
MRKLIFTFLIFALAAGFGLWLLLFSNDSNERMACTVLAIVFGLVAIVLPILLAQAERKK